MDRILRLGGDFCAQTGNDEEFQGEQKDCFCVAYICGDCNNDYSVGNVGVEKHIKMKVHDHMKRLEHLYWQKMLS